MYALIKNQTSGAIKTVFRSSDNTSIPFDPANTDYQQFRKDVAGDAELQDADGVLMTAEEVKAFVKKLP